MSSDLRTGAEAPPTPDQSTETTHHHLIGKLGSVFWTSVSVSAIFVAWAVLFTENLNKVTTASLNWVTGSFGWLYLLVTLGILVFLIFLAFSRSGNIRLGKDTDRPEFSTLTWLAMILSAVMGIGLVSYGVAEPISHLATPPHGLAEAGSPEAAVRALQYSYFDWGLHAWAIFAVFGLALA
jgi:choline-glycine betaine transporter